MIRIATLVTAFLGMLFFLPVAGMADEYDYYDHYKEPLGIFDVDKKKCIYFPDIRDKRTVLETYKFKFVKYGYDLKLFCFFPLYYHSYLDEEDGFKCVIAKKYKIFKRTYDTFFEPKHKFAILGCKFKDKYDYGY